MIPSQRHLFDIPEEVIYLNCAFTSPLLRAAREAGRTALAAKATPWNITPADFFSTLETVRGLFGQLVNAPADDVAIIPAASYGIALAAGNIPVKRGQTIVVLADQFPSNVYAWRRRAAESGAAIVTVARPADGDWTTAVTAAVTQNTAVVALGHCHWTDGTLVDLVAVGARCRALGAALVVDATQSLGAMPFSVPAIQPDFLITTAHKWLLGPYSFGFCYVAPRWQQGIPLEENWLNRAGSEDFAGLVDYRDDYQPGARRFDVGEASNFVLAPVAATALGQLLEWEVPAVARTLRAKTDRLASGAASMGVSAAPAAARAPHMIGLRLAGGNVSAVSRSLAAEKIYVSIRGDCLRIAPHLYTTEAEIDRFLEVLAGAMAP